MSGAEVEIVRTPMATTSHPRRRLEERFGLRFPRLADVLARAVWRLPRHSRIRRALVHRMVRIAWEAFNRGDLEATFMLYHRQCESTFPPELPTIGVESGTSNREERVRVQRRYIEELNLQFEPSELIEVGDQLLSVGHMKGTGAVSRAPVDTRWVAIFTTEDGCVTRERIFVDYGEAFEAVGLPRDYSR